MRLPKFAEVRSTLRSLFSEEAAQKRQETTAQEITSARALERLGNWLTEISGNLREELENPKEGKPSFGSLGYGIDIDGSIFSAEQLKTIAPQYVALHDICLKHNVSLEIAGFDRLPHAGTGTNHSYNSVPSVSIEVDRGRTYNGMTHPNYRELSKAGVKLPISFDRPEARVCRLS